MRCLRRGMPSVPSRRPASPKMWCVGALSRSGGIARGRLDLITLPGIAAPPGGALGRVGHVAFHHLEGVTIATFCGVKRFIGGPEEQVRGDGGLAALAIPRLVVRLSVLPFTLNPSRVFLMIFPAIISASARF